MRNLTILLVVGFWGIISCNQDDDSELQQSHAVDRENIIYQKDGDPPPKDKEGNGGKPAPKDSIN